MACFTAINYAATVKILREAKPGAGNLYNLGPHELCIIAGEPQNQLILS